ncbi:hypothetical protein BDF21DRAFT_397725 [Thamnidium elegans]|nr:hypothetical protein BDF21DRAFT_397725 [Thamnidium elegans]
MLVFFKCAATLNLAIVISQALVVTEALALNQTSVLGTLNLALVLSNSAKFSVLSAISRLGAYTRPISRTNSRSAKPVDIPHTIYFDKYMAYNVNRIVLILERVGSLRIQLKRALRRRDLGVHAEIANLVNDPPSQERLEINMQYDMAVEEEIGELEDELEEAFEGFKRHPAGLHAVVCFRSEHFWVYIFDYEGGEWWMYNDTQVRIVAEDEVFDLSADYACNLFYINRQVRNDYC